MNTVLKSYVDSVAGVTLTEEEAFEFLKGLNGYEISSSLPNQGDRKASSGQNFGAQESVSIAT
jgi:hypothetical protein